MAIISQPNSHRAAAASTDPRRLARWRRLAVGLGLLATGVAAQTVGGKGDPADRPTVCWQAVDAAAVAWPVRPLGRRQAKLLAGRGWLAATDGAHPETLLTWGDQARAESGTYASEVVRSAMPQVFLREPEGKRAIGIHAFDRDSGVRRLTVRTVAAGGGACTAAGADDSLEIEAVNARGHSTCFSWPLADADPLAALISDAGTGKRCLPIVAPDLVGRTLAEARRLLEDEGLGAGRVEERAAEAPPGQVVAQDPGPGAPLSGGARVDLVVAGERLVQVPDLMGQTLPRAAARLAPVGLELVVRSGGLDLEPAATAAYEVAIQRPPPGATVAPGSAVEVEAVVGLPDLRGRPLEAALGELEGRGLTAVWGELGAAPQPAADCPATVTLHRPAAGHPVSFGAAVELEVAVAVPDLRGLSPQAASGRLGSCSLRTDPAIGQAIASLPPAAGPRVVSQRPAAGAGVPLGTPVEFGVAVAVPGLLGVTAARARDELLGRALRLAAGDEPLERWLAPDAPEHRLAAQRPVAGTLVVPGSTVEIDLEVRLPDLRGRSREAAGGALGARGLGIGGVTAWASSSRLGQVVSQSPWAGSWRPAGSAVDLMLAGEPPPLPPPPSLWPWLVALAVLGAAWGLQRLPRGKLPKNLQVEGRSDAGRQSATWPAGKELRADLRLRIDWDPGQQRVDVGGPDGSGQGGPSHD